MYLINTLTECGQGILKLRAVRAAKSPEAAQRISAEALPKPVASVHKAGFGSASPKLSAEQIEDVVAYLSSLKK